MITVTFPPSAVKGEEAKNSFRNLVRRVQYGIKQGTLTVAHTKSDHRDSPDAIHIFNASSGWWLDIKRLLTGGFRINGGGNVNGRPVTVSTIHVSSEKHHHEGNFHDDKHLEKLWYALIEYIGEKEKGRARVKQIIKNLARKARENSNFDFISELQGKVTWPITLSPDETTLLVRLGQKR